AIETDRPLLGGTGDQFPLLGERLSHPVYHRTHARGAAQIRMNDDPVFGSEFKNPRGQPLEQRMAVADIARQRAARVPAAARCLAMTPVNFRNGFALPLVPAAIDRSVY